MIRKHWFNSAVIHSRETVGRAGSHSSLCSTAALFSSPFPSRNVHDAVPLVFITVRAWSFRGWLIPRGQSTRASSMASLSSWDRQHIFLCSWMRLWLRPNKTPCAVTVACIVFSVVFFFYSGIRLNPIPQLSHLPSHAMPQTPNPTFTPLTHFYPTRFMAMFPILAPNLSWSLRMYSEVLKLCTDVNGASNKIAQHPV